jgi:hypothetical protein
VRFLSHYTTFGLGTGRPEVRSTLQLTTLRTTRAEGTGDGGEAARSGDVGDAVVDTSVGRTGVTQHGDLLGVDTRLNISRRLRVVSPSVALWLVLPAEVPHDRTGVCIDAATASDSTTATGAVSL